jgi:hypothetical protein
VTCATSTCGGLGKECAAEASELDADVPTIVPVVSNEAGTPLVDVQVKMDGTLLTSRLDGRSLSVDPGLHEFSFSTDSGASATQKIMVVQGQRNRPITVSLRTPPKAAPKVAISTPASPKAEAKTAPTPEAKVEPVANMQAPSAPPAPDPVPAPGEKAPAESASPQAGSQGGRLPVLPIAMGGAGALAVGTGVLLNVWGHSDNSALSQCKPNCPQSSLSHIRTIYTLSDISFGVGAVAIGAAAWLLLPSHPNEDKASVQPSYSFDVQPVRSGAYASVSGQF